MDVGSITQTKKNLAKWSSDDDGPFTSVGDWVGKVKISTAHEKKKNWQYQATYAEDGKQKDVIQYFDGKSPWQTNSNKD